MTSLKFLLPAVALAALIGCGGGSKTTSSSSSTTGTHGASSASSTTSSSTSTGSSTSASSTSSSGSSGSAASSSTSSGSSSTGSSGSTSSSGSGSNSSGSSGVSVVAVSVTPTNPTIASGTTIQLQATSVSSDGTVADVTSQATWTSSDSTIADVSAAGLVTSSAAGTVTITATLGTVSGSTTITVTSAVLSRIDVTAASPTLARGTTTQLTATGTFSDGTTQDLTTSVTWSSSDTTVATVDDTTSKGLVSGVAPGAVVITATDATSGKSGTLSVFVSAASLVSISVQSSSASIANGTTEQFTATGTFSDGSTQDLTSLVTWASSDTTVATISNTAGSRGLASAVGVGTAAISATDPATSITNSTNLTVTSAALVSIAITPVAPSIANGTTQQFTAVGTYSDATTQDLTTSVTWSSSDISVATISNAVGTQGLASALAAGPTQITALDTTSGISASVTLNVTSAALVSITVTPTSRTIAAGTTLQYTAVGTYSDGTSQDLTSVVTWASSDTTVAQISNAAGSRGLASAVAAGPTTISATDPATNISNGTDLTVSSAVLVSIAVTPGAATIAKGTTQQFTATGTFSDGTTQDLTGSVAWSTSDSTLVTMSGATAGLAQGQAAGSVQVTATDTASTISGSASLTVTSAVLVSITVTPDGLGAAKGTTQQFTATGGYSDGSSQDITSLVTWTTGDSTIAQISNTQRSKGLAYAQDVGSTSITATDPGGTISGSATWSVTAATLQWVEVTPGSASVAAGNTQQFDAVGHYSDGTTQSLTATASWSSSDTSVATMSATTPGQAQGVATGLANITALDTASGLSGSASLTVTNPVLLSIDVEPQSRTLNKGDSLQYTATGSYSDGSSADLTSQVTWASSDTSVAGISNTLGSKGLVSTVGAGGTNISATLGSVSQSTDLTVNGAALVSLAVTPVNPTLGTATQQFTATGTYTDGTMADLTTSATWSSSDFSIVRISNASGTQGLATPRGNGSATVTAQLGGLTASSTATVTNSCPAGMYVVGNDCARDYVVTSAGNDINNYCGEYNDCGTNYPTLTWTDSPAGYTSVVSVAVTLNEGIDCTGGGTANVVLNGADSANIAEPGNQCFSCPVTPSEESATISGVTSYALNGSNTIAWKPTENTCVGLTGDSALGGAYAVVTVVYRPALSSLAVTPSNSQIHQGASRQLTATATYADGSTADVTSSVTWSSSSSAVVSISSTGLATRLASGDVTITATSGSASATATVTSCPLDGMYALNGACARDYFIPVSQLVDVANDCGGGNLLDDCTTGQIGVSWTDDPSIYTAVSDVIATLNQGVDCNGGGAGTLSLNGTSVGTMTEAGNQCTCSPTASEESSTFAPGSSYAVGGSNSLIFQATSTGCMGLSTDSNLSGDYAKVTVVYDDSLKSIAVTPANPYVPGTKQFTAVGTYGDGSTADLTSVVTWASNDATAISISSSGLATANKTSGTVTISATLGSVVGSTTATAGCPSGLTVSGGTCTQDFFITSSSVTNLTSACDANNFYNDCSSDFALTWTDNASGLSVVSVSVVVNEGVDCNNTSGSYTLSLNGTSAGSIAEPGNMCTCNTPTTTEESTSLSSTAGYVVGGANSLDFAPVTPTCVGLSNDSNLGGDVAKVTVAYQ